MKFKRFLAGILCCTLITTVISIYGNNAAAWNDEYDIIKYDTHIMTAIYYDPSSKDIYMTGKYYNNRALSDRTYRYRFYKLNSDKTCKMEKQLALSLGENNDGIFYINNNSCSKSEFDEEFFEYENNYKRVDADAGMTEFEYNYNLRVDSDYSFINKIQLSVGDSTMLKSKFIPTDNNISVNWKSSDSSVAEVDNNGKITAKSGGSCTVSAYISGVENNITEYTVTVEGDQVGIDESADNQVEIYDAADNQVRIKDAAVEFAMDKGAFDETAEYAVVDIDGDKELELLMTTVEGNFKTLEVYEYDNTTDDFELKGSTKDTYNAWLAGHYITTLYKIINDKLYVMNYSGGLWLSRVSNQLLVKEFDGINFNDISDIGFEAIIIDKTSDNENESDYYQGPEDNDGLEITPFTPDNAFPPTYTINDEECTEDEYNAKRDEYLGGEMVPSEDEKERASNIVFVSCDTDIRDNNVIGDSDCRLLTRDELSGYTSSELADAINEIYARHGLIFEDEEVSHFFYHKPYYKPQIESAENISFNYYEDENIKTMVAVRNSM